MTQYLTPFTWTDLEAIFKEEHPSIPLRLMFDDGSLHQVLPEIADLYGVEQPKAHHPEGHAFEHTMQVLDEMRKLTDNPAYLMAALCHDVGKGITPMELRPKHHNHEKNGVPIAQAICERLGVPADITEATLIGTENHGKFHRVFDMRAVRLVDFLNFHNESALGVDGIAFLGLCDHRGRNNPTGSHECFDAWFEMWEHIKTNPAIPGERPDDTRKRHARGIEEIRKTHTK